MSIAECESWRTSISAIDIPANFHQVQVGRSEEHTSELQSPVHLVYLPSFPTRRSSDLQYGRFDDLPRGARLATGSTRRRAQVLNRRPDLNLVEIRGNVDSRVRKLADLDLGYRHSREFPPGSGREIGRAHV